MGIEFDRLLASERRAEQVRREAHRRDADRGRGVAWSGLRPDVFTARADDALMAEAARRLAALETWRASRDGRLLAILVEAQRAAESLRAVLARAAGEAPPLIEMSSGVAALADAARRAETLMDDAAANALSGAACATNTASSSPSTASPSSSAS